MEMAAEDLDKNERKNMNMNKYSDLISSNRKQNRGDLKWCIICVE